MKGWNTANIINVKVIGESHDMELISQAIVDITEEHKANKLKYTDGITWQFRGSIINFSMGWGSRSSTVGYALNDAVAAGISVFAGAGNHASDASSTWYPCSYGKVTCVSAVDNNYRFASSFANFGGVVEYLAPGDRIWSLGHQNDTAVAKKSGTSMACPHVAGTATIFGSWEGLVQDQMPAYI
jgi:subtilisin family serine protease